MISYVDFIHRSARDFLLDQKPQVRGEECISLQDMFESWLAFDIIIGFKLQRTSHTVRSLSLSGDSDVILLGVIQKWRDLDKISVDVEQTLLNSIWHVLKQRPPWQKDTRNLAEVAAHVHYLKALQQFLEAEQPADVSLKERRNRCLNMACEPSITPHLNSVLPWLIEQGADPNWTHRTNEGREYYPNAWIKLLGCFMSRGKKHISWEHYPRVVQTLVQNANFDQESVCQMNRVE
jgi:hypothetical protein